MTPTGTSAEGLEPRPLTALHSGPSTEPGHPGVLELETVHFQGRVGKEGSARHHRRLWAVCKNNNNWIQTGSWDLGILTQQGLQTGLGCPQVSQILDGKGSSLLH